MLESASFHVVNLSPPSAASSRSSLQFCVSSSLFFHRVVAPMLCLGPLDPSPCSLGLSSSPRSGGCSSCALLCAVQGCMSACRTRPAANPGGPQGGAQTGRSPGGGGGWREAESNLAPKPNDAQWRAPTDGAPTGSVANERQRPVGTISQCKGWITNQEQHNKYPCYRIRDTQSL